MINVSTATPLELQTQLAATQQIASTATQAVSAEQFVFLLASTVQTMTEKTLPTLMI